MLNRSFTKPLPLTISGQSLTIHSVVGFEFCLGGRDSVPVKTLIKELSVPREQLRCEAKTIFETEQKIIAVLSRSIEHPGHLRKDLKRMDSNIFSRDHCWREIMNALSDGDRTYDDLRRVALTRYIQYLRARQELIKTLYVDPTHDDPGGSAGL